MAVICCEALLLSGHNELTRGEMGGTISPGFTQHRRLLLRWGVQAGSTALRATAYWGAVAVDLLLKSTLQILTTECDGKKKAGAAAAS